MDNGDVIQTMLKFKWIQIRDLPIRKKLISLELIVAYRSYFFYHTSRN